MPAIPSYISFSPYFLKPRFDKPVTNALSQGKGYENTTVASVNNTARWM